VRAPRSALWVSPPFNSRQHNNGSKPGQNHARNLDLENTKCPKPYLLLNLFVRLEKPALHGSEQQQQQQQRKNKKSTLCARTRFFPPHSRFFLDPFFFFLLLLFFSYLKKNKKKKERKKDKIHGNFVGILIF
jgi:hypothetical protein